MMQEKFKFFSSRLWKVILVAGLAGIAIYVNPRSLFDPVHRVISLGTYPFQKAVYQLSSSTHSFQEFISSLGTAKRENEELIDENLRLTAENAHLAELEEENRFLREQLSLLPREKYDLEGAFVISRDPHGLGNWIEIDKGSNDGIREGMGVIISGGVMVGRITSVFPGSSRVLLVSSPESLVSAFDVRTGAKGIVQGEYDLGSIFDMVLQEDALNPGDEVVSAGSPGGVPQGLLIGKVEKVGFSANGLFRQAILSLPVKFSQLRVVFVIK